MFLREVAVAGPDIKSVVVRFDKTERVDSTVQLFTAMAQALLIGEEQWPGNLLWDLHDLLVE